MHRSESIFSYVAHERIVWSRINAKNRSCLSLAKKAKGQFVDARLKVKPASTDSRKLKAWRKSDVTSSKTNCEAEGHEK